MLALFVKVPAM